MSLEGDPRVRSSSKARDGIVLRPIADDVARVAAFPPPKLCSTDHTEYIDVFFVVAAAVTRDNAGCA